MLTPTEDRLRASLLEHAESITGRPGLPELIIAAAGGSVRRGVVRRWRAPIASGVAAAIVLVASVLILGHGNSDGTAQPTVKNPVATTENKTPDDVVPVMTPAIREQLYRTCLKFASLAGDATPTSAAAVATTSADARQYLNAALPTVDEGLWLVQLRGTFQCVTCHGYVGKPTQDILTIAVDPGGGGKGTCAP